MNQLSKIESLSIEEVRKMQLELAQREIALLGKELERVDHEHKETITIVKQHDGKIENVENKTAYLESNMVIHSKQAQQLANLGKLKCIECVGGKDAPAYKALYSKMVSNFWGYFKQVFQLVTHTGGGSYKDLRARDFDKAKDWISNYKPAKWLQDEIDELNNQIQMDI